MENVIPDKKRLSRYKDFIYSVKNGLIEDVKEYLSLPDSTPAVYDNYAIKVACQTYTELPIIRSHPNRLEITRILLQDPRIDPGVQDNYIVRSVVGAGDIQLLRVLLNSDRVDPGDWGNQAIKIASRQGLTEIVKLLLNDERVDPRVGESCSLQSAINEGHSGTVKALLEDGRSDPTVNNNHAIKWLSMLKKYIPIIKMLIDDGRIDTSLIHPIVFGDLLKSIPSSESGKYLLLATKFRTPVRIDETYIGSSGDWSGSEVAGWSEQMGLENSITELSIDVTNNSIWPAVLYAIRCHKREVLDVLREFLIDDLIWMITEVYLGYS